MIKATLFILLIRHQRKLWAASTLNNKPVNLDLNNQTNNEINENHNNRKKLNLAKIIPISIKYIEPKKNIQILMPIYPTKAIMAHLLRSENQDSTIEPPTKMLITKASTSMLKTIHPKYPNPDQYRTSLMWKL